MLACNLTLFYSTSPKSPKPNQDNNNKNF